MVSPFPGMDPYLEHPATWLDVHNALIAELRRTLGPLLRPHYYVRLEERTYLDPEGLVLVGRPDVAVAARARRPGNPQQPTASVTSGAVLVEVPVPDEVRETWLEVRGSDGQVVTVLEVLSPGNKRPGPGRAAYEEKRLRVLGSRTHLVEIDLLRGGQPMPVQGAHPRSDYRILVSRGDRRPGAELFAISVRQPIPAFRLPLRGQTAEPEVALRAMLDVVYETGAYGDSIDYGAAAVPPLEPSDAEWARDVVERARAR